MLLSRCKHLCKLIWCLYMNQSIAEESSQCTRRAVALQLLSSNQSLLTPQGGAIWQHQIVQGQELTHPKLNDSQKDMAHNDRHRFLVFWVGQLGLKLHSTQHVAGCQCAVAQAT